LNINGKEEMLTFKPKGLEQCNKLMVLVGPKKNAKPSRKKSDRANYSTSNTSTVPQKCHADCAKVFSSTDELIFMVWGRFCSWA
jgi:hypothetical protein